MMKRALPVLTVTSMACLLLAGCVNNSSPSASPSATSAASTSASAAGASSTEAAGTTGASAGSATGTAAGSAVASSLAEPAEKITLTFSSYAFQAGTVKATEEIVSSWNAAHPNIQVQYQKVDAASVHDKLVTQFAGNSAPDIIHDETADLAGFSAQGYLADLAPLLPAELKADVPQSVWDSVTYGGKLTGVPTISQVYCVFANTDLLAKSGVKAPTMDKPWTWDELHDNAKKLTAGDVSGFGWGLKSPTAGIMSTGLAFDGTFFSGDEAKPTITVRDNEMQIPNRLRAMLDDKSMGKDSISLSGTDILNGFIGGKYAMVMAGNYVAAQLEEKAPDGFNWTMLPLLKGTSQHQAAGSQTLSISRQSKNPQYAMAFIAYFMKAENLAKIAEGDALIPVTASAAAIVAKNKGTTNGWDAILAAAKELTTAPWTKADKFPQWKSDIATPAYQEFLAGKLDAAGLQRKLTDGWQQVSG